MFCRDGEAFLFRAALGEFLNLFKKPSMTQCHNKKNFKPHVSLNWIWVKVRVREKLIRNQFMLTGV